MSTAGRVELIEHVAHFGPLAVAAFAIPKTFPRLQAAWATLPQRSGPIPAADVPAEWRVSEGLCVLGVVLAPEVLLLEFAHATWATLRQVHDAAATNRLDRMTIAAYGSAAELHVAQGLWSPQGNYGQAAAPGLFFPVEFGPLAHLP